MNQNVTARLTKLEGKLRPQWMHPFGQFCLLFPQMLFSKDAAEQERLRAEIAALHRDFPEAFPPRTPAIGKFLRAHARAHGIEIPEATR